MRLIILILLLVVSRPSMANTLSVSGIGATLHGGEVYKSTSDDMVRKITPDGAWVWHPELNLSYVTDSDLVMNITIVNDCFGNDAYYIGVGRAWFSGNHQLSAVIGIYSRQIRPEKLGFDVPKDNDRQYFPLPWLGYQYAIPISRGIDLVFQVNTNYLLTHFTVGVRLGN